MGRLGKTLAGALSERAEVSAASDPHRLRFGGDCEGFLYLPRSESPAGAVVILHERYGMARHTLDLAQRLARDGYVALAPDLFSLWRGDREALRRGEARVVLPDPEVAAVIDKALDFLKTNPRVSTARIALMGVCQSGRYPIVVGSRRRDLAACVVFYGASQQRDWKTSELQPEPMQEMMRRLAAPALFVYGERDHTISLADVRRTRDALEDGRCSYRMKLFPGMPHGWLNDTMPGRYRAKEAEEAWGMLLAFLAEVFSGTWPGAGQVRWEFEGASSVDYDFSKNTRLE
jgi:carboxymethylenebutenolidase